MAFLAACTVFQLFPMVYQVSEAGALSLPLLLCFCSWCILCGFHTWYCSVLFWERKCLLVWGSLAYAPREHHDKYCWLQQLIAKITFNSSISIKVSLFVFIFCFLQNTIVWGNDLWGVLFSGVFFFAGCSGLIEGSPHPSDSPSILVCPRTYSPSSQAPCCFADRSTHPY